MRPKTNGMVEGCNGLIEDALLSYRFKSGKDLGQTILLYVKHYNQRLSRSALVVPSRMIT